MAFSGAREDHLAIRELYDTYADAGSRLDRAGWLGCYAADARWRCPYFDHTGIGPIADQYDAIMVGVTDVTFFIQIGALEVEGDQARCRLQQSESLLYTDGSSYDLVGQYEDVLVRREGRWRFLDRDYTIKRESRPRKGVRFSGAEADRIAIRELHATYADAASRQDKQQWLDCFADGGVWDTSAGAIAGKDALAARWDELFATMDAMLFVSVTGAIHVDGDTATATDHVREVARIGGAVMKFAARYEDECVRVDGAWRFARRRYCLTLAEQ